MSGVNPTREADTADSAAITQADIMAGMANAQLLPEKCPVHKQEGHTLMFRGGRVKKAVFACDCVWTIAGMFWEHHGEV